MCAETGNKTDGRDDWWYHGDAENDDGCDNADGGDGVDADFGDDRCDENEDDDEADNNDRNDGTNEDTGDETILVLVVTCFLVVTAPGPRLDPFLESRPGYY